MACAKDWSVNLQTPVPVRQRVVVRYRNRDVREADLEFIRSVLAQGSLTRPQLSREICAAWDWRQANGRLREAACRDLLLRLEEWGHIKLPPSRRHQGEHRRNLPLLPTDLIPLAWCEIRGDLAELGPLVVRPIAPEERLGWRTFVGRYHYLGCQTIVGEHLLYAAFLDGEMVALLAWASAALHAPLREQFVGWDEQTKRRQLHLVANNVRFLIPPWVRVRCLASRVLACNLRRLSADWQKAWGHPLYLAETFVDTARFRGTCYRASNWTCLGKTAGRSKRGNVYRPNGSPKTLFVYELHRRTRNLLRTNASAPFLSEEVVPHVVASAGSGEPFDPSSWGGGLDSGRPQAARAQGVDPR